MNGAGSMQSNEEKGAEKQMDDYLNAIGLHRKKIAKDGSCLFRAVAEQVLHCQSLHTKVRAKCVEFLRENKESYEAFIEGDFEDYLFKLQDPQQWVGEVEINALAVIYKRDFLIFQEPGKPAVNITDNNFKDKVRLCFLNGNHYDSVYPISRIKDAALCQSILYELLYDGVFKVERGALGPCQWRSRPSDPLCDDNLNACVSSDESDQDAGEPLWVEQETSTRYQSYRGRGRGRQLPERVRRSLNPTLFRNVEYDVWHKTKRAQQKMDYCIAAGMMFTAGDRCQVRHEGRNYNATVREVPPNNGPVTVYIEELGNKKQVPLWNLRPPCDEGSWCTVVKDKRLSNGHGDWEERGRGRGRGKHVVPASSSSSSSVSQATAAAGSSGRVLKQHSWPPQAAVEEQGGAAKTSRKSLSSADFGLTDKERLAREEEERTVALLEIHLRDENSFPALGAQAGLQGDGAKKKGDRRKPQRSKTKSPVEDVRAPSPSAGERPKSSTPPLPTAASTTSTATTTNTRNTTTPTPPVLPAADSNNPAWLSSIKASPPHTNMAAAAASVSPSYAVAAAPTSPSTKPPAGGAVPPSVPSSIPSSASLFSFLTPALPPAAASSPPAASLPPESSASPPPPPPSALPPPTFIAPIAPSPTAAQGFLPRSSPPVSSLPHSPSPPPSSSSSSSSVVHQAAPLHEAPPVSAQNSLPNIGALLTASQSLQSQASLSQIHAPVSLSQNQTQTQTQTLPPASLTQAETQTQPSLPQNTQNLMPQVQPEAPSCLPHLHLQPQVSSAPHPPPQYLPQPQCEAVQPSHSYPHTSQASAPHPHLHVQPPHPSQVPHPSLSLSTPDAQAQSEASLPPPQPGSPAHAPSQPPLPPPHPQLQSAPPPALHQSIPGAVPLQQLSQLYQDPLYPGFPQGEKGDIAPTPAFSSSKSGDDLPQDLNILRFFFNLGVKAYSMPYYPPCIYLLPLQQAHTLHPKLPSRSPSPTPHYPPSNPPARHQEAYPHAQYPPTSASMPPQYDHQAPLAEPPHPSDPSFSQAGYPVTQPPPHRVPWQQQQPPPRNPSYPAGYPTANAPYRASPTLSQGYHPGQGLGHPLYPQYPPSSLGYQSASSPEELQVSQGGMEQRQPTNGDPMPGHGPGRGPGPQEGPAANMAYANNNRTVMVPGFALKKEPGDALTRAVLLVDPPLNNKPQTIITLLSNPDVKDVSMTTTKPSSSPGSPAPYDIISQTTIDNNPRGYRGYRNPANHPTNAYVPLGPPEHSQVGYLQSVAMAESLSVGCSTEDDWEGFKPPTLNQRGPRKSYRGGRGRGGYDQGRGGYRRRHGGEAAVGMNYLQFSPSHRGRGRERGY